MEDLGVFEEAKGCLPEPAGYLIEMIDNNNNVHHVGYVQNAAQAYGLVPMVIDIQAQGLGYKPTIRTTPLFRQSDINWLAKKIGYNP